MREQPHDGVTLFGPSGSRKYLNAAERLRFVKAAQRAPSRIALFCLTLRWTGGRISEVLALTPASIDIDSGVVSLETLKRRKRGIVRQVPLPPSLLDELDREFNLREAQRDPRSENMRLWHFSRQAAWRYVKATERLNVPPLGLDHNAAFDNMLKHGLRAIRRYLDHRRNLDGDRKLGLARSLVDHADDVTQVWSPTDALAYCTVLKKNIERREKGDKQLMPDLDSMLVELLLRSLRW
jgi:hypothetical protein